MSFLAALASLPRLVSAIESLVETLNGVNSKAAKARASQRRQNKDDAVDQNIAALVDNSPGRVPGEEVGQRRPADGSTRFSCRCKCRAGVDTRRAKND